MTRLPWGASWKYPAKPFQGNRRICGLSQIDCDWDYFVSRKSVAVYHHLPLHEAVTTIFAISVSYLSLG